MLWLERFRREGRCRVVLGMSGEAGSFLTTILGALPRDERGERLPSATLSWWAASLLLEEVGEALWWSPGSLEAGREGVTAWGEEVEVEGAMAAYVLDEPTGSGAGMEGLATTVVMAGGGGCRNEGSRL